MQINGIAHIQLTVRDFDRCRAFYQQLLTFLEMTPMFDGDGFYYCVGGKTGIAICRAAPEFQSEPFQQRRAGLHHFCLRVRQREDIDALYQFVATQLQAPIIRAPREDNDWAPGYYSLLFEDPEGIRIEANFVPGKGNLDPAVSRPKAWEVAY